MVQHLSVASIGINGILIASPIASNRQFPVRSSALEVKKLVAELNEHRYYLERKVEQRTEQLVKRIELLESCNTTLCNKLAQAKRDIAALQKQIDNNLSGIKSNNCTGLLTGISLEIVDGTQNQPEPDGRIAA